MKLVLRFCTTLGPRTVIAEVADTATGWAILSAHQASGNESYLVDEAPRFSMKAHMAAQKRKAAKAAKLSVVPKADNAPIPFRKARK